MKLAPHLSSLPGPSSAGGQSKGRPHIIATRGPGTVAVLLADGAWAAGRARCGRGSAPSRPGPSRTRAELRAHAPGDASPARRRDSGVRVIAPWTVGRVSSDSYRDSDMLRSCPFSFAFLHLVPEFSTHQVRSGMQNSSLCRFSARPELRDPQNATRTSLHRSVSQRRCRGGPETWYLDDHRPKCPLPITMAEDGHGQTHRRVNHAAYIGHMTA